MSLYYSCIRIENRISICNYTLLTGKSPGNERNDRGKRDVTLTEKELRKLRRSELLEMLIEQKKLAASAQRRLDEERSRREEAEAKLKEIEETNRNLNQKLDDRDKMINDLRAELEVDPEDPGPESLGKVVNRLNKAVNLFETYAGKLRDL